MQVIYRSLSAWRAWIEIRICKISLRISAVALRMESVDRNLDLMYSYWLMVVALRMESVDRNIRFKCIIGLLYVRRSPHGERG